MVTSRVDVGLIADMLSAAVTAVERMLLAEMPRYTPQQTLLSGVAGASVALALTLEAFVVSRGRLMRRRPAAHRAKIVHAERMEGGTPERWMPIMMLPMVAMRVRELLENTHRQLNELAAWSANTTKEPDRPNLDEIEQVYRYCLDHYASYAAQISRWMQHHPDAPGLDALAEQAARLPGAYRLVLEAVERRQRRAAAASMSSMIAGYLARDPHRITRAIDHMIAEHMIGRALSQATDFVAHLLRQADDRDITPAPEQVLDALRPLLPLVLSASDQQVVVASIEHVLAGNAIEASDVLGEGEAGDQLGVHAATAYAAVLGTLTCEPDFTPDKLDFMAIALNAETE